LSLVSASLSFN